MYNLLLNQIAAIHNVGCFKDLSGSVSPFPSDGTDWIHEGGDLWSVKFNITQCEERCRMDRRQYMGVVSGYYCNP